MSFADVWIGGEDMYSKYGPITSEDIDEMRSMPIEDASEGLKEKFFFIMLFIVPCVKGVTHLEKFARERLATFVEITDEALAYWIIAVYHVDWEEAIFRDIAGLPEAPLQEETVQGQQVDNVPEKANRAAKPRQQHRAIQFHYIFVSYQDKINRIRNVDSPADRAMFGTGWDNALKLHAKAKKEAQNTARRNMVPLALPPNPEADARDELLARADSMMEEIPV